MDIVAASSFVGALPVAVASFFAAAASSSVGASLAVASLAAAVACTRRIADSAFVADCSCSGLTAVDTRSVAVDTRSVAADTRFVVVGIRLPVDSL